METNAIVSIVVLVGVVILSASGKLRYDVVAIGGLFVLFLAGVLTLAETLKGFADPIVLMIAATFVIGQGVVKSGIADMLAQLIITTTRGKPRLLVTMVMLCTAFVSAFMSSTGTVAIMMPVAISAAASAHLSPSKVLLPTAYAALLGAWLTLIATPPNMIVSDTLVAAGLAPFGFFDFTVFGVVGTIGGTAYMALVGMWWLPDRIPVAEALDSVQKVTAPPPPPPKQAAAEPSDAAKARPWYRRAFWRRAPASVTVALVGMGSKPTDTAPADAAALPKADDDGEPAASTKADEAADKAHVVEIEASVAADPTTAAPAAAPASPASTTSPGSRRSSIDESGAGQSLVKVVLLPNCSMVDKAVAEIKLRHRYGVSLVAVEKTDTRGQERVHPVYVDTTLRAGNGVYMFGPHDAIARFLEDYQRQVRVDTSLTEEGQNVLVPPPLILAEFLIPETSVFVGRTLKEAAVEMRYSVVVLSVRKGRQRLFGKGLGEHVLSAGDMLLVTGHLRTLRALFTKAHENPADLVFVASYPDTGELGPHSRRNILTRFMDRWRFATTVIILLAMLIVMTGAWLPNAISAMLAAFALVVFRVIKAEEAYRAINWESIVLTASMLGVVGALSKTGIIDAAASAIASASASGPYVTMIFLFFIVSLVGQLMSNTACTVLFAPVALSIGLANNISPRPLLMAVDIAASSAFMTPIGSPVVTMVYNPGAYTALDYVRVGTPLFLFMFLVTVAIAPAVFPFNAAP